jgi:hypothetical protein
MEVEGMVVVSLTVCHSQTPQQSGAGQAVHLNVANQLTRETATSLLHLFHHLATGAYIGWLVTTLDYEHDGNLELVGVQLAPAGVHFNPAIFEALRHARSGVPPSIYVLGQASTTRRQAVFRRGEESGELRIRFKE